MPLSDQIYYFETKNGKAGAMPVILVHGAGGSLLHWPLSIRRPGTRKVYALDLPGHGRSGGLGEQSVRNYAGIVQDWMIEIHVSRAVIIGHAMGCAIALSMALHHPDYVAGIILLGAGAKFLVDPGLLSQISSPAGFPNAVNLITKRSFSPGTGPRITEQVREQLLQTRPSVLHGDYLACRLFDISEPFPPITHPTSIICGELDDITPVRYSEFLAENIPGAELTIVPGAGHMVMLEQPDLVAQTIEDFIERIE